MAQDIYKTHYYNQYSKPSDAYRRETDPDGHHYSYESQYSNFSSKFKYDEKSGTYQLETSPGSHLPDVESQTGSDISRRGLIPRSSGSVITFIIYHVVSQPCMHLICECMVHSIKGT